MWMIPMRYQYWHQWDTDTDTDERPIPIPMRCRYRYPWDTRTDTNEIPIPIPMRYQYRYHRAKREAKIFLDYLRDIHEIPIPIPMRYRYPWDTNTDTTARSAKRKFFRLPPRASRLSRNILYYLREPLGTKVRILSHTTSASLPAGRPNTTFNGAILLLTRTFKKHCKNHTHTVKQ